MRKGFGGLSAIVRQQFAADPTDGSLFIFINRRLDRMRKKTFAWHLKAIANASRIP